MTIKQVIEFAAALIGLLTFGTVLATVIILGMAL
jgi:hypothetical protein